MKKRSVKSQSSIITAVLLIIIVIFAVVIVWNVVYAILKKSSAGVGTDIFTTQLEIKNTKLYVTGGAQVQVYRTGGKGTITGLKFIFENKNGERKIVQKDISINELETKNIDVFTSEIGYNNLDIKAIYLVPILENSDGMEVSESANAVAKDADGNRLLYLYDNLVISPEDLVSWWKFDRAYGAGNKIVLDSVYSKNNGTLINSATISNGVLVLNAINTPNPYAQVINNPSLIMGTEDMTFSIWIKLSSTQYYTQLGFISKGCGSSNDDGYVFKLMPLQKRIYLSMSTGNPLTGGRVESSSDIVTIDSEKWYNVAASVDRDKKISFYLNGIPAGSTNSPSFANPYIGGNDNINLGAWVGGWILNGAIDDAMIFKKALSVEQIKIIYDNQKANHQ